MVAGGNSGGRDGRVDRKRKRKRNVVEEYAEDDEVVIITPELVNLNKLQYRSKSKKR